MRSVLLTIVAVENNEYYTTRLCVFLALGIQHAMHMCVILSPVVCPALQYFPTLSYKRHDFRKKKKKKLLRTKCVLIFSAIFV